MYPNTPPGDKKSELLTRQQIFLTSKKQQTLQTRHLRTGEALIFFLKGWLASTFFHVLHHSIARMACQKLMLEIFILIFRAPCAVLAPGSWLGQKNEIATHQKLIFLHFWQTPPGVLGGPPRVPGGPVEHLSHKNEAPSSRNRTIKVPTPDFGKKTSKNQKSKKTK